jgi:sulfopropanediol 3-dehydrogenase
MTAALQSRSTRDLADAVHQMIEDVRARGDAAVREMSARFDRWEPDSFRLSDAEIDECVAQVDDQTLDDIRFAQAQVRRFAEAQRASAATRWSPPRT